MRFMIFSPQSSPVQCRISALFLFGTIGCFLFNVENASGAAESNPKTGAAIYRKLCIECHATNGKGVTDKANPFQGRKTLDELTMLIEETMPEEDPELCKGEDARQVAEYVLQHFFTSTAGENSQSARVQLSHMTVQAVPVYYV